MENQIEDKVISFFKDWKIYNEKMKNKTIINTTYQDFLDLEMIFELFFKEFNIANSEDFNVDKYFYKISFFNLTLMKFGIKIKVDQKPILTIEHMIKVVQQQKWFDPTIAIA